VFDEIARGNLSVDAILPVKSQTAVILEVQVMWKYVYSTFGAGCYS
jgi:hypothetical protein